MIKREDIATQGQLMYVYNTSQKFLQEHGELSVCLESSEFDISVNTEALHRMRPNSLSHLGVGSGFTMRYEADDGPQDVDSWPTVDFLWLPADVDSPFLYRSVSIFLPSDSDEYVTTRYDEIQYLPHNEDMPWSREPRDITPALLGSIDLEAETGVNLLTSGEISALRGIMHALMRQTPQDLAAMKRQPIG